MIMQVYKDLRQHVFLPVLTSVRCLVLLDLGGVGEHPVAPLKQAGQPLLRPFVDPQVDSEVALGAESALTRGANIRFIPGMRPPVDLQMAPRWEHLGAEIATEQSVRRCPPAHDIILNMALMCVDLMGLPVAFRGKAFAACLAREWFEMSL